MTVSTLTHEELDELLTALDTHKEHLAKVYARPGLPNNEWRDRMRKITELKCKLIGMKS